MRKIGLAAALVLLVAPQAARAGQEPSAASSRLNASPDFFLGPPKASLGVRGGMTFANASSDWYHFVTEQLTLEEGDFRSANIAGELVAMLPIPVDLVLGGDFGRTTHSSEFRHFVDNNRLPIEQRTTIRVSTLTAGLRWAFLGRGEAISSLVWVPRTFVPYVGGGFGGLLYKVKQEGDFVDFATFAVFSDELQSSGWTTTTYANVGMDVHMTRRLYLTVDARYLWAEETLHRPWREFEPLDLAGLRLTTGINLLF